MIDEHPRRDIASQRHRDVPRDFLQSIFALELLAPSNPIWILSPWISNVELIDNRGGRFSALEPAWPNQGIRLLSILQALSARGGSVVIIANLSSHNDEFERRIGELEEQEAIRLIRDRDLHAKGIFGERFMVTGSMNLTQNGVFRNDEHLIYDTDPARIHEWRIRLQRDWGE